MDIFIVGADSYGGLALAREFSKDHKVIGLGLDKIPHSSTCFSSRMLLAKEDDLAYQQIKSLANLRPGRPLVLFTDHPRNDFFLDQAHDLANYAQMPLAHDQRIPHSSIINYLCEKYDFALPKVYEDLDQAPGFPLISLAQNQVYFSKDQVSPEDPGPFKEYIKGPSKTMRQLIAFFSDQGDLVFYASARAFAQYPAYIGGPSILQTKSSLLDAALLSMAKEVQWRGFLSILTKEDPYTKKQYILSIKNRPGNFTFLWQRAGLPLGKALLGLDKEKHKALPGQWGRLGQESYLALGQSIRRGSFLDLPLSAYVPLRSFGPLWTLQDPGVAITYCSDTLEKAYQAFRTWRALRSKKSSMS